MQTIVGLIIVLVVGDIVYHSLSTEAQTSLKIIGAIIGVGLALQVIAFVWSIFKPPAAEIADLPGRSRLPVRTSAASGIRTNRGPILADGVSISCELNYTDAGDIDTQRKVTIHTIAGTLHRDGSISLDTFTGFCHLRQDDRTFRFERVQAAANPDTGEIISDFPGRLAHLAGRREPVRGVVKAWPSSQR